MKTRLDIDDVKAYLDNKGVLKGYPNATPISNEELLTLRCDVLIPAALGDVFDKELAKRVQCKFIIEGANGPTLPEADVVFNERGIIVAPRYSCECWWCHRILFRVGSKYPTTQLACRPY